MTTKYVSMGITRNCNLNCTYCYESHKNDETMNFDTIDRILEKELNLYESNPKYDLLEIDPFGGEPFLGFEKIKHITEYVRGHPTNKPIKILISTNGTLVHGEVQEWIVANKDLVVCGLSLDGTKEMHDANRSGSYDSIDKRFFLEHFPDQTVKMTVSEKTLPHMAEGVIHCHEMGFRVLNNLAYGIDFSDEKYKSELEEQLRILIDYYLSHPDIEPCSMLGKPLVASKEKKNTVHKWCGAGNDYICYDTKGDQYPCQFFQPLTIGERSKSMVNVRFEEDFPSEMIGVKCKECSLEQSCPSCYGQNFLDNGDIHVRSGTICHLTKTIIKARIFFFMESWKRGTLHYKGEELISLVNSMYVIINSGDLERE